MKQRRPLRKLATRKSLGFSETVLPNTSIPTPARVKRIKLKVCGELRPLLSAHRAHPAKGRLPGQILSTFPIGAIDWSLHPSRVLTARGNPPFGRPWPPFRAVADLRCRCLGFLPAASLGDPFLSVFFFFASSLDHIPLSFTARVHLPGRACCQGSPEHTPVPRFRFLGF
ncbi:hypothetical protein B0J18DRAFT_114296 [Chaetomium sp. MPI-SDFR-AT-0129]|nr:hypothetical protein B0J18DRAFT_114296 [Chaetomium sp. MPI-SDFR-AT-0129]